MTVSCEKCGEPTEASHTMGQPDLCGHCQASSVHGLPHPHTMVPEDTSEPEPAKQGYPDALCPYCGADMSQHRPLPPPTAPAGVEVHHALPSLGEVPETSLSRIATALEKLVTDSEVRRSLVCAISSGAYDELKEDPAATPKHVHQITVPGGPSSYTQTFLTSAAMPPQPTDSADAPVEAT